MPSTSIKPSMLFSYFGYCISKGSPFHIIVNFRNPASPVRPSPSFFVCRVRPATILSVFYPTTRPIISEVQLPVEDGGGVGAGSLVIFKRSGNMNWKVVTSLLVYDL